MGEGVRGRGGEGQGVRVLGVKGWWGLSRWCASWVMVIRG